MGTESVEIDDKRDRKRKNEDKQGNDDVCRDFLRNVCKRGLWCKFKHESGAKQRLSFCHDFQNGYCHRTVNCKFIHSSYDDEKYYLETGHLPPHLSNKYGKQHLNSPNGSANLHCKSFANECWGEDCGLKNGTPNIYGTRERQSSPLPAQAKNGFERMTFPYCRSYLLGNCRDDNCKFRHAGRSEYQSIERGSLTPPRNRSDENNSFAVQNMDCFEIENEFRNDYYEPKMKRTCISENDMLDNADVNGFENKIPYLNRSQPERSYIMLEEENIMLRERITELKKRIDDLQVTNEFLLEQNARFRLQQDKNAAGLTTMTVPAVTITNSMPGANQMQQNPTPQQMVTAALRTVTASVATVPVSIATVTPVSLSAVSMAPVQQMQGSVMTLAQQSAPTGDPQIAQPLPISISAPTVPLVSYPVMSHTVMQQTASPLNVKNIKMTSIF